MKLNDFVVTDAIIPVLQAESRDDAIAEMVDSLVAAKAIPKGLRDEVIKLVLDREKHGSTGFGKGVAVPHVKHDKIKKVVASVAVSQAGVDFNSLDEQPVYCLFLLASPKDKPDEHLQAMENLFNHLQTDMFRKFMRQAETKDAVIDVLNEADAGQLAR
ncbi:MAG: PTS sugar transporter subunit IIA [Phycisphaeraceae bacterium]|jgi:mannitol/fructose-specific phosphotransferase system IIA component (Ntr-type)